MKKTAWILGIGFLLLLNSCRKDVNDTEITIINPGQEVNVISNMRGVVTDENGEPVASALVTVRAESTFTNDKGEYSFDGIVANQGKEQIVVTKEGYFTKANKMHNEAAGASYNKVTLLSQTESMVVNTSQGGTFPITGGLSMVFPSNSLRKSDGTSYDGEATVYARYSDPASGDFPKQMMSELVGIDSEGSEKALKPLGMLNLEIKTDSGELLEINEEAGLELEFPIPPDQFQGQSGDIPSWIYDLEEEFWLQDVDCYPATAGNYGCTIYSTGAWACCQPVDGVKVSLDVFNEDLTPASFVKVEFDDNDSYFHFGSYTNAAGRVRGTIPANEGGFGLTVQDLCDNIVHEETDVGPYATYTNLPDIYLDVIVDQFSMNVQGALQDCNGMEVNDGWVNVRYPGYEKNFGLSPGGIFDFDVYFNCVSFPDMEIVGYDGNGELATDVIFHNQLSDLDVGTLTSCEPSASFAEIGANGNTMKMFPLLYDNVWSEPTDIFIKSQLPGGEFYIRVNNYDGLGFHSGDAIISNEDGIFPDMAAIQGEGQALSVEITLDDGEYLEGGIIGTINDGAGNFIIDVTFRARKKL